MSIVHKNTLDDNFPVAWGKLQELFGSIKDQSTIDRLNEVYESCEGAWERNLDRLKGKKVKYVLIGEAAPWTGRYFYTTFDKKENGKTIPWIRSVWKVFFEKSPPDDVDQCLVELAKERFLLVDTLPFAMNYGSRSVNKNESPYKSLVKSCLPYFLSKIQDGRLSWSTDVKVAFAFKKNGEALIEALPNGITFSSGQHILLDENMIAATGSGLPVKKSLAQKWGIYGA